MSRYFNLLFVCIVFNTLGIIIALLDPPDKVWLSAFDPPGDNSRLLVQLKVREWWNPFWERATLEAGTELPILGDACKENSASCPKYTLPGDVVFQIGTYNPQDFHRITLFLTDTGKRVPIFSAPTESVAPGCSGKPLAICCGGKEYVLERSKEIHSVYEIWSARPNGTWLRDGTAPNNFRSARIRLNVTSGSYAASVVWPNVMADNKGQSSNPASLEARTEILTEDIRGSIVDIVGTLFNQYYLLVPTSNPSATGFVVPKSLSLETADPLDEQSWRSCRSTCSAPLNACLSQGPTPYPSFRNVTTATILAESWNSLNRNHRHCHVLGNGQQSYYRDDLTVDALHSVQWVNCDYLGVSLVPVIHLSRAAIDAGNPAPTSPPSQAHVAEPDPKHSGYQPTPPPQYTNRSPVVPMNSLNASPPPPKFPITGSSDGNGSTRTQGVAIAFIVTVQDIIPQEFVSKLKDGFVSSIHSSIISTFSPPLVRIRSVLSTMNRRRMLLGNSKVLVDTVVEFSRQDATAALAFATSLRTQPSSVFPSETFGEVVVSDVAELNCLIPCGPNGDMAPKKTSEGIISCTCECKPGWMTEADQSFDSFEYCTMTQQKGDNLTSSGDPEVQDTYEESGSLYFPPPPPPKTYKRESGLSMGGWIGLLLGSAGGIIGSYVAWKSGCAMLTWSHCLLPAVSCCFRALRSRKTAAGRRCSHSEQCSSDGEQVHENAVRRKHKEPKTKPRKSSNVTSQKQKQRHDNSSKIHVEARSAVEEEYQSSSGGESTSTDEEGDAFTENERDNGSPPQTSSSDQSSPTAPSIPERKQKKFKKTHATKVSRTFRASRKIRAGTVR